MWERFHKISPGDFGSTFIKAGNSETKERPRVTELTGESLGKALLWFPRNVGKEQAKSWLLLAHWEMMVTETEENQGGAAFS